MTLIELFEKVEEQTLSKENLEAYRDQLAGLQAKMLVEMASVQKEKALFIDKCEAKSDIDKKRKWQVTPKGLRELDLKGYIAANKEILSSLKSRLYSLYV